MLKKLLSILLFISCYLLLTTKAFAADEFATGYDVVYDVGEDGITTVTEKITLRNLTSQFYANQFKLTIGTTQIFDIKASDGGGPMEVKQEQKDSTTSITVRFNQQVAGINKTLPWTLQFKSKDFAEKEGKVWEIRAPKVSASKNLENYNLAISVPTSFGDPTLISPIPKSQTTNFGRMFLTFDKSQLQTSGVSASFGSNQLFDFDLSYHLENNNLIPILVSIALPPDTAYQDVVYQRLDPKPLNVTVDNDGNYLAWYKLNRTQKLDVKLVGSAKLYTYSKVKNPFLSTQLRQQYTKADKYWEKDNPQIQSKLAEILGPNPPDDSSEKVKLIYHYVVDSLKYDSTRLNNNTDRMGAVTSLNNPQSAVCMEFTDLFIALTRAANIPARELNGFAYSSNTTLRPLSLSKDILHSWPEYYDEKKGWVMVDPTWENTTGGVDYFNKLDLNHFVFVTKGFSSEQPIPAGSYKYNGQDSHDVKVTLSDNDFLGKPLLDVKIETPDPLYAGFPNKAKIKITNLGNSSFPPTPVIVTTTKVSILNGQDNRIGSIPAFGSADLDYDIRTGSLFNAYEDQLAVVVGGQKYIQTIKVTPFLVFRNIPAAIAAFIFLTILLYLAILTGFFRHKRSKSSLKSR